MSPTRDLDAIRVRADAATEGPWRAAVVARYTDDDGRERGKGAIYPGGEPGPPPHFLVLDWLTEDAEFIAHAREDVPVMAAEVERLRSALVRCDSIMSLIRHRNLGDQHVQDVLDLDAAIALARRLTEVNPTSAHAVEVIHLSDPECGPSYCGKPVTLIKEAGDTRPVCQVCHRGAMKTRRSMSRDALARAMYLTQARAHQHPDDPVTPERRWNEGFEFKSMWFHQANRLLDIVDTSDDPAHKHGTHPGDDDERTARSSVLTANGLVWCVYHKPVRRRDGNPPLCEACGLTTSLPPTHGGDDE